MMQWLVFNSAHTWLVLKRPVTLWAEGMFQDMCYHDAIDERLAHSECELLVSVFDVARNPEEMLAANPLLRRFHIPLRLMKSNSTSLNDRDGIRRSEPRGSE